MQLHHIAIKTFHLETLGSFYQGLLGQAPQKTYFYDNGRQRSLWFDLNGVVLMLEDINQESKDTRNDAGSSIQKTESGFSSIFKEQSRSIPPGFYMIALGVNSDEWRVWIDRLKAKEITIHERSKFSVYFNDSDGNRLALSSYPTPHEL